jgi:hypothetical protein
MKIRDDCACKEAASCILGGCGREIRLSDANNIGRSEEASISQLISDCSITRITFFETAGKRGTCFAKV